MEFRLLGPLEVVDDRGTVALRAAKPRAVLAVLLLHANQPVSAERLAAALWGDEVQPDAERTVRVSWEAARHAGAAMTLDDAVAYALAAPATELPAAQRA